MRGRWTALCLAWVLLAFPGILRADGVMRDSIGARPTGRGGTNIAHYDNGAIIQSNPAGMININGEGLFEISADLLITDLDYSEAGNSTNGHSKLWGMPEVSFIKKSKDNTWAAGFGVFIPAGFGGQWEMNAPPPIPGSHLYKSFGTLARIVPAAAFRVTDRLSVGATLGVGISHAELEGPFFLQTGFLAGAPALLDLQATGATPTWSVGLQYELTERTMLGLVYNGENRFTLDGHMSTTVFLPPVPQQSRFDADVDLVWPGSLGGGITHVVDEHQRISADVTWTHWAHAFDRLDIELHNASNPVIAAFGTIRDSFPLAWKDSITSKVGYEYFLTPRQVVRVGYINTTEIIPDNTLSPYIPATLEHTFTAGYGTQWEEWRVDFAYQFAFGPDKYVDNSALLGGDFVNSELKAQTHWAFITLSRLF